MSQLISCQALGKSASLLKIIQTLSQFVSSWTAGTASKSSSKSMNLPASPYTVNIVCSDSFNQCPFDNHQTVESASQCFCEAISWSVSPKTVSQWVPNDLTSDLASQPPEGSVSWYVLH